MKRGLVGLLFLSVIGACGDDGTLQDNGTLGAPCYPDGTCVAGLICEAEVCVEIPTCTSDADCNDSNICTVDSCDLDANECVHVNQDVPCDDADLCTVSDICVEGVCTGGEAVVCEGDPCADSVTCVPAEGCVAAWLPEGAECDDGNPCTESSACDADHSCVGANEKLCDDSNPCTADSCNMETGECVYEVQLVACDDGSLCTNADICQEDGTCQGLPVDCSGVTGACLETTCNPDTGACDLAKPDGTSCADENLCNGAESCEAGECVDGTPVECPASGALCTLNICEENTGSCVEVIESNCCGNNIVEAGEFCDDGNLITEVCTYGETSCTICDGACLEQAGQTAYCGDGVTNASGGETCDDGNAVGGDCCGETCMIEAPGTVCRAAADVCDVDEICDGVAASCPADVLEPAGTVCRDVAGGCDVMETCTGSAVACPDDAKTAAGTLCRAATDVCDVEEACDGIAASCPEDGVASAATVCRESAGDCDVEESCTGTEVECPADVRLPAGDICRASTGECDIEEVCDGASAVCTADEFFPADLECDDDNEGTKHDVCDGTGICVGVVPFCGDDEVDAGEHCDDGNTTDADGCSSNCVPELCVLSAAPECTFTSFKLTPEETGSNVFGEAVAMSGDTLVVSGGWDPGAVHIYTRGDTGWDLQQEIVAPDDLPGDLIFYDFGQSIAVSGDTLAVGAAGFEQGLVYVYVRNDNVWSLEQTLSPQGVVSTGSGSAGDPGAYFGYSISIHDNTIAVGARWEDISEAYQDAGAAYIFTRSGTVWTQQQRIAGIYEDAEFGFGVAITNDRLVVSEPKFQGGAVTVGGQVRVYTRSGAIWELTQTIKGPSFDAFNSNATFGSCVAISNDHLVVGAPTSDGNVGAAYVYDWAYEEATGAYTATSEQKLIPTDGAANGFFGQSVALSEDMALIGRRHAGESGSGNGAAYVFRRSSEDWAQEHKVIAPDGESNDRFGRSVAADNGRFAVGADPQDHKGYVYVYDDCRECSLCGNDLFDEGEECDDGNATDGDGCSSGCLTETCGPAGFGSECILSGTEIAPVDDGGPNAFGQSIAISGDTLVVGSEKEDCSVGGIGCGAAYVYVRTGGVWTEQQKLTASDGNAGDLFGNSVSISGDTIVVASVFDDAPYFNSGSAYVYTRSGGVWTEQQKLTASDGAESDIFGHSVAINGDTIAVGANSDDDNGGHSGSVYVFVRSGGVWTEQQKLIASDGNAGDSFGFRVAIHGDSILVGAPNQDESGNNGGAAYLFTRVGTVWTQEAKLMPSDGEDYAYYGQSVAIDADALAVGAPVINGYNGAAYVYTREGIMWAEQKLTAGVGIEFARFGYSVSLVDEILVVGAIGESFGGDVTGAVYVYNLVDGLWAEQHKLIRPGGVHNDNFGVRVAVEGNTIAVGAYPADDKGFVRVYEDCVVCSVSGAD